jgi:signal transduction histidine kinase
VTEPVTEPVPALPVARRRAWYPRDGSGLHRRVYLLMAIGIFFPLVVISMVCWYWLRDLDARLQGVRVAGAETVAAHFDEELTGDLELLQRLAARIGSRLEAADPLLAQQVVREAFGHFRHREAVFLLDSSRRVVAEEPFGRVSAAPNPAIPLVEEVLSTGLPRLSSLQVAEGRPSLVHELVPVRDLAGAVVGVAGGTFDPSRRDFYKMLRHLRQGQTGRADLIDANGLIIASSEMRRAGIRSECSANMARLVTAKVTVSSRCDVCHAERGERSRTGELMTFAPLASAPWGLVVRQDAAEASPTEGAWPWFAVGGVLLAQVALSAIFAWGAARSVTQPVAVLTAEAERIASGQLAWPIPELGQDEVGQLGQALDRMRQSLQALVARVERDNLELEGRVEERTRDLNQANAALREREVARGELLRKVITAQEDERKRVARELHDETTQALAALLMRVDQAAEAVRAGKTPALDELRSLANRALADVHRLILDLRPSVLDDLGLASAVRWYAERSLSARGVAVRCEVGELPDLTPELETALFRICQEALSNVARHAQASHVLVELRVEGPMLCIDVEDDGVGFDQSAVALREGRPHWGLLGIQERADLLGGHARFDSSPGAGTRVEVRIPLSEEHT